MSIDLTVEHLNSLFYYKDGELYNKVSRGAAKKDNIAGNLDGRYRRIKIHNKSYRTHRLIFFMFNGYLPEAVDHINGNSLDNRIENLRAATASENQGNTAVRKDNTSGYKGVSRHRDGKFQAAITKNKKRYYLGLYNTPEEAYEAYCEAALELQGDFARLK
jgi:hypothetical protein